MKHFVAVALVLGATATTARAEPEFAIREGLPCSACHVNRTGGGKRNAFGVLYGQTVMPVWNIGWTPPAEGEGRERRGLIVDPHAGDYISFGLDFRAQNLTTFSAHTVTPSGKDNYLPASNTFRIPVANLYAEMSLFGDNLVAYIDETVGPEGASMREGFVMYQNLPWGLYIKAGRILLPYGVRLPDDTIFVRDMTGFNYANQDLGGEIGFEKGPLFGALAVTNGTQGGTDNNLSKQVTGTIGALWRKLRLGLSYSWADGTTDQAQAVRHVGGAFAGLGIGRLSLLAEGDFVRDLSGPGSAAPPTGTTPAPTTVKWQWAWYSEADLLLYRGINLRLAFDYQDPDLSVANDQRVRYTAALEVAPVAFLRVGVFYYLRRDIPQNVAGNQDQLIVQVHGFL